MAVRGLQERRPRCYPISLADTAHGRFVGIDFYQHCQWLAAVHLI